MLKLVYIHDYFYIDTVMKMEEWPTICLSVNEYLRVCVCLCMCLCMQASKNRIQEVQEAANILSAARSCFQHTALDYVNYITLVQSRKVPSILSTVSVKRLRDLWGAEGRWSRKVTLQK